MQDCRDFAAQCARKDAAAADVFARVLATTPRTDDKWLPSLRYALRFLLLADRMHGLDTQRAARCRELGLRRQAAFPAVAYFKTQLRQAVEVMQ